MIPEITKRQLEALALSPRPLVISDVDEVVVHFTRDLEIYLGTRGLWLDTSSFAISGNIRGIADNVPFPTEDVPQLIEDFFADRALHMEAIDGAVDALLDIAKVADVVMLTNLPHAAGENRRRNLKSLGLPFPVITNSGPKGPAIRALADATGHPTVFIDDSPSFIVSAYEHAPKVHLVHFMHDERFARHIEPFDYVSLTTGSWEEARLHVIDLLAGAMDSD